MLTFSEALVQLKAGQDLKVNTWPRGYFARVVMVSTAAGPVPELHQFKPAIKRGTAYQPTQAEMFGQQWSAA